MTTFGLDDFLRSFPKALYKKQVGIVCHAASITSNYIHIVDVLVNHSDCTVAAIFGPQHGLFGQTQDNMVEWEGAKHPTLGIPVYSLYGKTRKPTATMLSGLDALVIDLQDVGARPYTYLWTLKYCMEACLEKKIPLWVLDRPNPIGCVGFDGPMLDPGFFSFVGGAKIPLCHRMTMGEIALLLKKSFYPDVELNVVWMEGWWRDSLFSETKLPWVLPSPNMPTVETAVVYPGMVLLEATNVSEGRGTTRPFELFGAPFIDPVSFKKALFKHDLQGCLFRDHDFIPTFQKWQSIYCHGFQIHVYEPRKYRPVETTVALLMAIYAGSPQDFRFKDPPYEYEHTKMPFDILAGDERLRNAIVQGALPSDLREQWKNEMKEFRELFSEIAHYPESRS